MPAIKRVKINGVVVEVYEDWDFWKGVEPIPTYAHLGGAISVSWSWEATAMLRDMLRKLEAAGVKYVPLSQFHFDELVKAGLKYEEVEDEA